MKLVKCKSCGEDISPKASTCPKCGHPRSRVSITRILAYLLVIYGMVSCVAYYGDGGFEKQVNQNMAQITNKVATDAVQQYEIAKRQGDPIQICVQAGFVSAAYLQAKDEVNYQAWKATERGDCRRAGVPGH